ncbi:MAG: YitT family protein [Clostridium sp.]|uniref:YitT family protein n=1 Tax=Clostridium sp. TaxID=1506 RepID=UPI002FC936BC
MDKKRTKAVKITSRVIFMIVGSILASVGLKMFLIPNNIIDGGVVGVSIMASYITSIPLGLFTFILNIPFLVIGYKHIGKTFAISSLFSIATFSIVLAVIKVESAVTDDVLLAAIFGGIILGVGVGMIIRNGGSLDGTEIIGIIMDKRTGFSVGEIVMFFNIFILGSSGILFGWDRAMYSLIAYFIAYKVIDVTVEGLNESKAAMIISNKYEDIADALMARLGRGVTLIDGRGGYKGMPTQVIYVVITRLEIAKLKEIVNSIDDNALVTIDSVEVIGKKYSKKAIH